MESLKGILSLCSQKMFEADQGANFGEQLAVLANSWKEKFACPDPHFFYTIPSKTLAPRTTKPQAIKGRSTGLEIRAWSDAVGIERLIEQVLGEAYK